MDFQKLAATLSDPDEIRTLNSLEELTVAFLNRCENIATNTDVFFATEFFKRIWFAWLFYFDTCKVCAGTESSIWEKAYFPVVSGVEGVPIEKGVSLSLVPNIFSSELYNRDFWNNTLIKQNIFTITENDQDPPLSARLPEVNVKQRFTVWVNELLNRNDYFLPLPGVHLIGAILNNLIHEGEEKYETDAIVNNDDIFQCRLIDTHGTVIDVEIQFAQFKLAHDKILNSLLSAGLTIEECRNIT